MLAMYCVLHRCFSVCRGDLGQGRLGNKMATFSKKNMARLGTIVFHVFSVQRYIVSL